MDKNRKVCGLGYVIRDSKGVIFEACSIFWPCHLGVEATELMAILEGLKAARRCSCPFFSILSDCSVIVALFNSKKRLRNDLGVLVDEVKSWSVTDGFGGFSFKPHSTNTIAHCLARKAMVSAY